MPPSMITSSPSASRPSSTSATPIPGSSPAAGRQQQTTLPRPYAQRKSRVHRVSQARLGTDGPARPAHRRSVPARLGGQVQPHRPPPGPPGAGGTVEHPRDAGVTACAPAIAGETAGAQPVPVALDHTLAAPVAVRALARGVVDVAGVGVADAVAEGDAAGPGQRPGGVGGRSRILKSG